MLSNLFISCYVSDAMCSVLFKVLKTQVHLIFIAILWRCCCLGLHGLQHARIPCPSLSPWVCSNSCPLSWWCHPTISSCDASSPALNLSQHQDLFLWVSSSLQVAKVLELSASVLPVNIQGWFPLELTDLIFLSKGLSRVFSRTTIWKHQFFGAQPFLWSKSHICTWLLEKPWLWLYGSLSAKWCLCFLICF